MKSWKKVGEIASLIGILTIILAVCIGPIIMTIRYPFPWWCLGTVPFLAASRLNGSTVETIVLGVILLSVLAAIRAA